MNRSLYVVGAGLLTVGLLAAPSPARAAAPPDLYECRQRTGDLALNRDNALHLLATDLDGGLVGIGWRWP
jgi:hypothetical protein